MTKTLAIGDFTASEKLELSEALTATFMSCPSDISALDANTRAQFTALAYKGHHDFGEDQMGLLPNLGVIANYGVGYDAIDVAAANTHNIKVTNTPNVLNDDVADLAVAMLLMQGRQMEQASHWARSGHWANTGPFALNRKISGGTVGIVGLGRIGAEIAARLAAFKMDIHYWSRSEKTTSGYTYHDTPESLASAVDYLIVALVGGPDTEKFVSAEVLRALGPKGIVVNISRGSTIDETALLAALEDGTIGGAGLDVFNNEPNIDARFYALDNVVIQPHQGSGTVETRAEMAKLQRDNISAFLAGETLLTPVN
jgi:lactate dehydrogenase-like 2-hydroxyacid dehydrogenase